MSCGNVHSQCLSVSAWVSWTSDTCPVLSLNCKRSSTAPPRVTLETGPWLGEVTVSIPRHSSHCATETWEQRRLCRWHTGAATEGQVPAPVR